MVGFDFGIDRLVIGLFTGLTYGMLAVGLVLVYRSSRFVNFAHGSVGAFGAAMLALFAGDWGRPTGSPSSSRSWSPGCCRPSLRSWWCADSTVAPAWSG